MTSFSCLTAGDWRMPSTVIWRAPLFSCFTDFLAHVFHGVFFRVTRSHQVCESSRRIGAGTVDRIRILFVPCWTGRMMSLSWLMPWMSTFAVVGVSGGGPGALACAWAMPDRIRSVGVVSGAAPKPLPQRGIEQSDLRHSGAQRKANPQACLTGSSMAVGRAAR